MTDLTLGIRIRVNNDGTVQVLNGTSQALNNVAHAANSANQSAGALSAGVGVARSMLGAFGLTVGAVGLASLARGILNTNREMEALRARLQSVTGTASEARAAFAFIVDFAKTTPFEIKGLTQAYITLQNFGIKPTTVVMEALTNQAAKSGASADNLQGIAVALGQAWGRGKLQGQEIMQLINQSVPVYDLLANVTGKNSAELAEMSEKGGLTRDVMRELIVVMGEMASGSNANAMETLNGKISSLADAWHTFEDALLNDKAEGFLKTIVTGLTEILDMFTRSMDADLSRLDAATKKVERFRQMGPLAQSIKTNIFGFDINEHEQIIHDVLYNQKKLAESMDKSAREAAAFKAQVSGQAESAKAAEKELAKLTDTNYKLTHSQAEYNRHSLEALNLKGADLERAVALANANDALAASQHAAAAAGKRGADEQARAYVGAIKSSQNYLKQLQDEAALAGMTASQKADFAAEQIATVMANAGVESRIVAAWLNQAHAQVAANEKLAESRKVDDVVLSQMDALIEKYRQLTLSARDYYEWKTKATPGIQPAQVGLVMAQYDKTTAAETNKKSIDDAREALETYNKTLDQADTKTAALGQVTSAVFDGALGGINAISGAFNNMVEALDKNTAAQAILHQKQAENLDFEKKAITETNRARNPGQYLQDLYTVAKNKATFAAEDKKLAQDSLKSALHGVSQIATATGQMFKENTNARRAFNVVALAASVAERLADLAGLGVKAAGAVLTQGQGDPYTAFARIAAMAAIVASVLGAAGAGTFQFGGSTATKPGGDTGTGTVLGDPTAKSESIDKAYELLKSIHAEEYAELRGINRGVASLQGGITNVVTRLFHAGGVNDPAIANLGSSYALKPITMIDPVSKWLAGFIVGGLFGKIKREIVGGGIATLPTPVSAVMSGADLAAYQYTVIQKTKKSWFSKKVSFSEVGSTLDGDVQTALNGVFKSMGDTMFGLAESLGGDLKDRVRNYIIPAMKVDLRGLSGEDASKKLNNVISAALDTMSTAVFGDIIGQYRKLGEGMLETAVRVVSEVAVVKDALATSGLSLADNAIAISDALAQAAGGLEEFQKQFGTYYDKFYSDKEKEIRLGNDLTSQLSDQLLVLPQTRDGYRKLIESLNINNELDQARYSLLIKLAGAADTYYTALESQLTTYTDAVATAKGLLETAYKNESGALESTIDRLGEFAKSLRAFRDSLIMGNLSTATPLAKYQAAKGQFNATVAAVQAGPGLTVASKAAYEAALSALQANGQTFLEASKSYYASSGAYRDDFKTVLDAVKAAQTGVAAAKTDAQNQLAALNQSVSTLITINQSVLSVHDAIKGVGAAVTALNKLQADKDKATAAANAAIAQAAAARAAADAAAKAAAADKENQRVAGALAAYSANNTGAGEINGILNQLAAGGVIQAAWVPQLAAEWTATAAAVYGQFSKASTASQWQLKGALLDDLLADFVNYSIGAPLRHPFSYYGPESKRIEGSHKSGLERVPHDGYVAELHQDERVLTAQEAAAYSPAGATDAVKAASSAAPVIAPLPRMEINIARPAWLDEICKNAPSGTAKAVLSDADKQLIETLKQANNELKEQNTHLAASVKVLQAGFTKLIQQNAAQSESLDAIDRHTRMSS